MECGGSENSLGDRFPDKRASTADPNDERGIDEETLEVRAGEITGSNIGDAPVLPELLDQIPSDEDIGSVAAGGAYDTRKCHEAIAARGATTVRQGKGPPDPFRAFLTPAPARTPSCGNRQALPPSPETKPYALRSTWAEPYGDAGVATTAEAVSRPR